MYADSGHWRSRWNIVSRAIILLPVGGREGINQTQVCGRLVRTQSCDRFSSNCGEGVRESVADSFGHSLTAKGGNKGRWSGRLRRPDERVPLPYARSAAQNVRKSLTGALCAEGRVLQ